MKTEVIIEAIQNADIEITRTNKFYRLSKYNKRNAGLRKEKLARQKKPHNPNEAQKYFILDKVNYDPKCQTKTYFKSITKDQLEFVIEKTNNVVAKMTAISIYSQRYAIKDWHKMKI